MNPSTAVVLDPEEDTLSGDAVPFAVPFTILNENIRADISIPGQEL